MFIYIYIGMHSLESGVDGKACETWDMGGGLVFASLVFGVFILAPIGVMSTRVYKNNFRLKGRCLNIFFAKLQLPMHHRFHFFTI